MPWQHRHVPSPLTHHVDESNPLVYWPAPRWPIEDLSLQPGQRLAILESLRNTNVQSQDEKQFHKENKEVQLTGKLSAGHHVGGPGVGRLPIRDAERGLGHCKALLQPFHLPTPILEGLPDHGQLLSHGMDVVLISFSLLIVRGGWRGQQQHDLCCRGM